MQSSDVTKKRSRTFMEAVVIGTITIAAFLASTKYKLHDLLHDWTEEVHVDEKADETHAAHSDHAHSHDAHDTHLDGAHAETPTEEFSSFLPSIGADEILTAGMFISLALLVFTILQLLHLREALIRRKEAEAKANNLAMHDALTGLPNRRHFEAFSKPLIEENTITPRALVIIDLDDFKPVNDLYGHAAGDQLLVECATRLRGIAGSTMAARFGGDEFCLLSDPLKNAEDAIQIGNRVITEMKKPFTVNNIEVIVGASIGIAMISKETATVEEAMRHADIALYRSKEAGKNTVSYFEKAMDEALKKRAYMEQELKIALKNDQIVPYFQKVVNLETLEIVGYEALARWIHPTLGVIQPTDFIQMAEEINLIGEVGYTILRKSAEIARYWPANIKLAINLSPVQLRDPACALKIMQIIANAGLMPQRLEVEITENALIGELERAQEIFGQLRSVGISIVMDDFGTGQSTLNHLRACNFDKIKIDRSFVAKMQNEPESELIVDAILGLSKGFGLVTTAEGIEDAALIGQLLGKGCSQGQGFYFGKPNPMVQTDSDEVKRSA
ncbi:MAG: putative bifunctional diguanylate cyclase/phosphodiesterase [Rhizobiaceae bacterium]